MTDIISNLIIDVLIKSKKNSTVDGKTYKYITKGGEGLIYEYNNKIIKIYIKYDINIVIKEFYVIGLLNELDRELHKNIITMDKYYLSTINPVLIMERMDGTLQEWINIIIKNNKLTQDEIDNLWMSMIFQVTYGVYVLNKLNIVHNDMIPKNILYKFNKDNVSEKYNIDGIIYEVPVTYIFKIADFGRVQILNTSLNILSNGEIKDKLDKRDDLYKLSRIIYRIFVNYSYDVDYNKLNKLIDKNEEFKKYRTNKKNEFMNNYQGSIKNKLFVRSLIYYAIENDIIDKNEIIKKHSLIMPSNKVIYILNNLIDTSDIFSLFSIFKL